MAYFSYSGQRLDSMQEQLNSIQQTLEKLTQGPTSTNVGPVVARPITVPQTGPTFEGQSSFHHQSLLAKDAAFTAVGNAQSSRLDDNVSAALSSLKDSLNRHPEPDSQRLPEPEFSREQLLPVDLVVAIVKRVKGMLHFVEVALCIWLSACIVALSTFPIHLPGLTLYSVHIG